jgi:hypothetical protein
MLMLMLNKYASIQIDGLSIVFVICLAKHPWLSMIPRVSNDTVKIKGWVRVTPGTGMVTKGTGTVWQKPTLGIPVLKPMLLKSKDP